MEWKVVKELDNRLLKRKELVLYINYDGGATPSKAVLQQLVAKKFAVDPAQVEISKIMSECGRAAGKVWVKIWDEPKVEVLAKPEEKKEEQKPEEETQAEKEEESKTQESEEQKSEVKENEEQEGEAKESTQEDETSQEEKPSEQ
jgi:ribosomal protein S24E